MLYFLLSLFVCFVLLHETKRKSNRNEKIVKALSAYTFLLLFLPFAGRPFYSDVHVIAGIAQLPRTGFRTGVRVIEMVADVLPLHKQIEAFGKPLALGSALSYCRALIR